MLNGCSTIVEEKQELYLNFPAIHTNLSPISVEEKQELYLNKTDLLKNPRLTG